jgi:hypothetical protein
MNSTLHLAWLDAGRYQGLACLSMAIENMHPGGRSAQAVTIYIRSAVVQQASCPGNKIAINI